ncbi:hypothetical protein F5I97DRAFT_645537 [Phlebopus sp. FC_14]|nr:hypothetical protein F5I97DRAFT_645537 [Phlebopus sp. FC_14]
MAAATSAASTSTSTAALRQFIFFDVEAVKDIHDPNCPPEIFKNAPEISTMTPSTHGLLIADIHGSVHLLNQSFVSVASWVVHVGGRVTHMVDKKGVLVTIGEEDNVRSSIMKIWDLDKVDKKTGGPVLLRSAKVQPSGKPHPVTSLALTPTLSFLAIGFADGSVVLYRHLDQSLASSSSSVAAPSASLPKPRLIHEIPTEPVTFLGFVTSSPSNIGSSTSSDPFPSDSIPHLASNAPPTLTLLITTTSSTYSYPILPKPSSPTSVLVDETGTDLRCACVDWKERWVVLGRKEGVYAVGVGGRLGVVAFEGKKLSLYTHLNYVAMVLPVSSNPASVSSSPPSTTQPSVGKQHKSTPSSTTVSTKPEPSTSTAHLQNTTEDADAARLILVDMENKLIAYTGIYENGIRDVVSAWGSLWVLGIDGKLTRLIEMPTPTKLSLLYSKHLYPLALSLAYTQGLDALDVQQHVIDVHKHHGDYLYEKGDYEGAMKEYVRTIGGLRASYVVRKFLTAHLTPLLTSYLQELHVQGLANAEHTTLLLNTYAKVGDVAKVDAFVRSEGRVVGGGSAPAFVLSSPSGGMGIRGEVGDGTSREPPFDLDTAIRVCRQAGFFEHAAYLAKRWGRHEDYLRVLVEDVGAGNGTGPKGSGSGESGTEREGKVEGKGKDEKDKITNGYKEAVSYLREVGGAAAETNLARYCRALLDNLPVETTQLLIDLCTVVGPLPPDSGPPSSDAPQQTTTGAPSYLSYLALSRAPAVPPALSSGGADEGTKAGVGKGQSSEVARKEDEADSLSPSPRPSTPSQSHVHFQSHSQLASETGATQQLPKRPSPTLFFAHFVDHPTCFKRFLETVAKRRWGQTLEGIVSDSVVADGADEEAEKRDQVAVWNTLLELYLTEETKPGTTLHEDKDSGVDHPADGHQDKSSVQDEGDKAIRLLRASHIPYDHMHALMLCSSYRYTPGLVLLWEKMGLYEDVLRFWMEKHNSGDTSTLQPSPSSQVISALRLYGPTHPHLYPLVLRFLTSSPALVTTHQSDLQEILEHVEKEKIMSPLAVVQVLSRNGVASVGLVKGWLMRRISEGRGEIGTDQQLISSYRLETETKLKQVEELTDTEHPKVFHVTRCSQCNGQLDLPSVHFMCAHSYHQRCLVESETACPLCTRQHGVIQEIRRNNERLADQHELFLAEVKEGGFRAVASGFGRGWLEMNVGGGGVVG